MRYQAIIRKSLLFKVIWDYLFFEISCLEWFPLIEFRVVLLKAERFCDRCGCFFFMTNEFSGVKKWLRNFRVKFHQNWWSSLFFEGTYDVTERIPIKEGKQCSLNTLLPIFGAEILILSITNMAELKSSNLNPY